MSFIGTAAVTLNAQQRGVASLENASAVGHAQPFAELIDWREAQSLIAPWRALAEAAIEANPFYEPWTLLPALKRYAGDQVRLACVWEGAARRSLLGFAPVEARRGYARLAVDYWATWTHPHCYFAAPLIHRGCEIGVVDAFLKLLCDGPHGRSFLQLCRIDQDGAVARVVRDGADGRICYAAGAFERAALYAGPAPNAYYETALRKKKRKELARLRNRLAEIGAVAIRCLTDESSLDGWTETFLQLEDRGWKGARGTSLKSSPADAAWFRESVAGGFGAGKLQFLRLDCGGRAIAMLANFLAPGAGYSVKIAHNPDFARFSPGVMIEIEATKRLLADPDFRFMDSCAAPDHPMINGLWKGRRRIAGVNVSGAGGLSKTALRLCQALERARTALPRAAS